MGRRPSSSVAALLVCLLAAAVQGSAVNKFAVTQTLFEDHFTTIDTSSWSFHYGDGSDYGIKGWGNNELQCYRDLAENVGVTTLADCEHCLYITEKHYPGGVTCHNPGPAEDTGPYYYTSAKLVTNQKKAFMWSGTAGYSQPVFIESRIKLASAFATGMWPAFWALPNNGETWCSGCGDYGGWCASGEIDMMEHINTESTYYVNLHYGGGKRINYRSCQQARGDLLNTPDPAGWHTFGTLWDSSYIRFFLDGVKVHEVPSTTWYSGTTDDPYAPFNRPFYLLLNLAVGGNWAGSTVDAGDHTFL